MGLARQGEQRGDRGGETMTESRCKLTLVETDRGAIAWCMKHTSLVPTMTSTSCGP